MEAPAEGARSNNKKVMDFEVSYSSSTLQQPGLTTVDFVDSKEGQRQEAILSQSAESSQNPWSTKVKSVALSIPFDVSIFATQDRHGRVTLHPVLQTASRSCGGTGDGACGGKNADNNAMGRDGNAGLGQNNCARSCTLMHHCTTDVRGGLHQTMDVKVSTAGRVGCPPDTAALATASLQSRNESATTGWAGKPQQRRPVGPPPPQPPPPPQHGGRLVAADCTASDGCSSSSSSGRECLPVHSLVGGHQNLAQPGQVLSAKDNTNSSAGKLLKSENRDNSLCHERHNQQQQQQQQEPPQQQQQPRQQQEQQKSEKQQQKQQAKGRALPHNQQLPHNCVSADSCPSALPKFNAMSEHQSGSGSSRRNSSCCNCSNGGLCRLCRQDSFFGISDSSLAQVVQKLEALLNTTGGGGRGGVGGGLQRPRQQPQPQPPVPDASASRVSSRHAAASGRAPLSNLKVADLQLEYAALFCD